MNRNKFLVTAALALAGTLAAGMAQARDDVQWSVTIGTPVYTQPVYQPAPVYTPAPVYPVYRPAPVYQPTPVYQPAPQHRSRHWRDARGQWDIDRDGIPNQRDNYDNRNFQRHDVDGDGVPNWKDHHDARHLPVWMRDSRDHRWDVSYPDTPYRRR